MPGSYEESWDGMDYSGIVDVATKENFRIALDSFSLPENTIILSSPPAQQQTRGTYEHFPIHPPHGTHSRQAKGYLL